jgi:hypothetical protein
MVVLLCLFSADIAVQADEPTCGASWAGRKGEVRVSHLKTSPGLDGLRTQGSRCSTKLVGGVGGDMPARSTLAQ